MKKKKMSIDPELCDLKSNVFFCSCFFVFVCTSSYSNAEKQTIPSAINNNDCNESEQLQTLSNPCPPSIYRTATGECNNINQRSWGARGDTFLRIFDPSYGNSVNSPRRSIMGEELPAAQNVLTAIRNNIQMREAASHITSLLPLWGHLVFRDIAHFNTFATNSTCCTEDEINPNCYVQRGVNCKEYARTMAKQEVKNCKFGK